MSFSRFRVVKTRKKHRCTGCSYIFPAGIAMTDFAGQWDGEFSYGHICSTCASIGERMDPGDTYTFGDLRDDFKKEAVNQGRMFIQITPRVENLWKTLVNEGRRRGPAPAFLVKLGGTLVEVKTEKLYLDRYDTEFGTIGHPFVDEIINDIRLGKWVCTCCNRWFETDTHTCPHCHNGAVSRMVEDFEEAQEPRKVLVTT